MNLGKTDIKKHPHSIEIHNSKRNNEREEERQSRSAVQLYDQQPAIHVALQSCNAGGISTSFIIL